MRTGERGISSVMRAAHDSSLCEGSLWGEPRLRTRKDFASAEARRWTEAVCQLSDCPRHPLRVPADKLASYQTQAGRGGSVSRRDHSPKTRKRAQLAWAHKYVGKVKSIPSRSSGEGVWGRGASLRDAASPPEPPVFFHLHLRPCVGADAFALGTGEVAEAGVKVSVG